MKPKEEKVDLAIPASDFIYYKKGKIPELCFICFGGLRQTYFMNPLEQVLPFEWQKECATTSYSYILVRDYNQSWYQEGLGEYNTIDKSVLFLQQIINELNPGTIFTTGCSAGGYAALIYGNLLKVDEVHSFCPQTWLDLKPRYGIEDKRCEYRLNHIIQNKLQSPYSDLKGKLINNRKTKYYVYCCRNNEDYFHLLNIVDTLNLTPYIYNCDTHSINNIIKNKYNTTLLNFILNKEKFVEKY